MIAHDLLTPRLANKTPAERGQIMCRAKKSLGAYLTAAENITAEGYDRPGDSQMARAVVLVLEALAAATAQRDIFLAACQQIEAAGTSTYQKLARMAMSAAEGAGQNAASQAVAEARK
jgi:hypothetical protein